MPIRWGPPLYGARYCGNINTMEVHDLENENTNCQIDEIIQAGHAEPIDTYENAIAAGFNNGHWCIGDS